MTAKKLKAILTLVSVIGLPSTALAEVVLGDRIYPEWKRAELRAACQGLAGQANESLTAEQNLDVESGDPASDFRLLSVPFTLSECKEAGLV